MPPKAKLQVGPQDASTNSLKPDAKAKSRGQTSRSKSPRPKETPVTYREVEAIDDSSPEKQASPGDLAKAEAKAETPLAGQPGAALGGAVAGQGAEASGPSLPAAAPSPTRESVRSKEEQKQALGSVWLQISKGKSELRSADIERLIVAANSSETGARVDADALREFMKTEFGTNSNVNEALFAEKASAYFESCAPSEECGEVWQMLGGSVTKGGAVEAAELRDMLQRLNYDVTKAELDDLVAMASKGGDRITYDDFVQMLFP